MYVLEKNKRVSMWWDIWGTYRVVSKKGTFDAHEAYQRIKGLLQETKGSLNLPFNLVKEGNKIVLSDEALFNFIANYASRTRYFPKVLEQFLDRDKCKQCNGYCCNEKIYERMPFYEMLSLQKIEATENGWVKTPLKEKSYSTKLMPRFYCKYHSETGCKLKLFKPILCTSYLCDDSLVKEEMRKSYFKSSSDELSLSQIIHYPSSVTSPIKLKKYKEIFESTYVMRGMHQFLIWSDKFLEIAESDLNKRGLGLYDAQGNVIEIKAEVAAK